MSLSSWQKITALYGGSFDPPHLGHLEAVRGLLEYPGIENVWLIPSGNPPMKKPKTSAQHRFKMTELTFADLIQKGRCQVLDIELKASSNEPHFSYHTIEKLKKETANLAFVIGSDQYIQLHKWVRFPDLFKLCHWIVLMRKENQESTLMTQAFQYTEELKAQRLLSEVSSGIFQLNHSNYTLRLLETKAPPLASHTLREQIALKGLTDEIQQNFSHKVIDYLKSEHLYGI